MRIIDPEISTHYFDWNGIRIEILYEPFWLGDKSAAHLQVSSVIPAYAPLPISSTGYRSHFLTTIEVDEAGGPVPYVRNWLDTTATDHAWRKVAERYPRALI